MPPSADNHYQPRFIGLLSPGWPPAALANGIVSYVATIAASLEEQQVHCQVLTSRPMGQSIEPFVHIVKPDVKSLRSKLMWRITPRSWENRSFCTALLDTVRRLHAKDQLDLLEIEESYGWTRYLWGRSPVPIVVRLHGPWFLNGVANGVSQDHAFHQRDRWERSGLLAADGITAPSAHVLQQTREHFGLALTDARVIANPVDPVPPGEQWNLATCDRNRIAFVGRFDRHKGGDTMIQAFGLVLREFPQAHLDFIGPDRGCTDQSGRKWSFDQYLQAHLSENDRKKVTYHGFLAGPEAAKLRKRALITAAPSRYETFGIAAAEAMMAGCPLVASSAGALSEMVQDGINGLTALPDNPADLADKLIALLRDPQRAGRLGKQAAQDAADRYSPGIIARQTIEFYHGVLARAPHYAQPQAPAGHTPARWSRESRLSA